MNSCVEPLCTICGEPIPIAGKTAMTLREIQCPRCRAPKRTRDLAAVLLGLYAESGGGCLTEALPRFSGLSIYEAQAQGQIHDLMAGLTNYCCSEFFDGITPGEKNIYGIRCENLEALTYEDNRFDLVITQDVFEHVKNPFKGFMELNRVLKPGGRHVFTVPLHEGRKTVSRIGLGQVYHGDPLREEGSFVHTDFGDDLPTLLTNMGVPTTVAFHEKVYSKERIPFISDKKEYERYLAHKTPERMLDYFLYNSVVFVSQKKVGKSVSSRPVKTLLQRFMKSLVNDARLV